MEPLEILRFTYGPFAENTYVVVGPSGRRAMVVDPGIGQRAGPGRPSASEACSVELILNTHGHLDHVACNAFFKRERRALRSRSTPPTVPLLGNVRAQAAMYGLDTPRNRPRPTIELVEGVASSSTATAFDVIHTPGPHARRRVPPPRRPDARRRHPVRGLGRTDRPSRRATGTLWSRRSARSSSRSPTTCSAFRDTREKRRSVASAGRIRSSATRRSGMAR